MESDTVERLYDMLVRLDTGDRVLFGEEDEAVVRTAIDEIYGLRSEVRGLTSQLYDGMV
jgi:hypothetical protein